MTEHELTPDDTAAMRAHKGDWREYLRVQQAVGNERRLARQPPPRPSRTGHRPGAWPPGTRPPDPGPPIDPAEVARAIAAYRASPDQDHPCPCPNCQLLEGDNR